jgi:hypothetical protein
MGGLLAEIATVNGCAFHKEDALYDLNLPNSSSFQSKIKSGRRTWPIFVANSVDICTFRERLTSSNHVKQAVGGGG